MQFIQKNLIVTGCDETYFPLAKSLINSIKAQQTLCNFTIAFLDGGLSQSNKNWLDSQDIILKSINFIDDNHKKKLKGRRTLLVNYYKPRLNLLFPEFDNIIFLDADTWVQTDQAFKYLLQASNALKLGIVSQASRLQDKHITLRGHFFSKLINRYEPRGILYKNGLKAKLSRRLLNKLIVRPVLNCGVYALNNKAPHWDHWQHWQNIVLKKGRVFTSDQLSLALAVIENNLKHELLPDICNFLNPPIWRFDESINMFTDLYLPHEPISIIHLAGMNDRLSETLSVQCINENDEIISQKIHYKMYQETV